MTLRIAYLTDERFPCTNTDCQQMIKNADALAGAGCEVDFVAPRMASHLFLSRKERLARIASFYNVAGRFELRDILIWPASRLRTEKLFHGLAAPLVALRGTYDVVYTRNLLPLVGASKLSLPLFFETYKALPETEPRIWRAVLRASKSKRFLGIATHSGYSRDTLIAGGADPDLVEVMPNGFDPADFAEAPERDEARTALGYPLGSPLAVYTGHIRKDKGVGALIDLAEDVPEVTLAIVGGKQEEVDALRADVERRGLRNVILSGHVPISRVPWHLRAADVLLVPPTAAPLKQAGRTVLPMKTFSYLAAARPILTPDLGDTKDILIDGRNALRVRPDDRAAAAEALRRLVRDGELAARLGANAGEDAKLYTWEGRAKKLVAFLERRVAALANR